MIIDPCWVSLLEIWLLNVSRLKFLKEYFFHFIQRYYDNQELDIFRTQFCKKSQVFFPFGWIIITWSNQLQFIPPLPEQLLWGGGDEAIISDGEKKGLKDTYVTSVLILWRLSWELSNYSAELFLINLIIIGLLHIRITANIRRKLLQDCGLCYLHLPIFFLNMHCPFLKENKNLWVLFSSVNYVTDHCSLVYIMRLFQF